MDEREHAMDEPAADRRPPAAGPAAEREPATDAELLRALAERSPEDLDGRTLEELRRRLRASEDFRRAFADELRFEQYLSGALARYDVPVGAILGGAGRSRGFRGRWGVLLFFAILLAAGAIYLLSPAGPLRERDEDRTAREEERGAVDEETAVPEPDGETSGERTASKTRGDDEARLPPAEGSLEGRRRSSSPPDAESPGDDAGSALAGGDAAGDEGNRKAAGGDVAREPAKSDAGSAARSPGGDARHAPRDGGVPEVAAPDVRAVAEPEAEEPRDPWEAFGMEEPEPRGFREVVSGGSRGRVVVREVERFLKPVEDLGGAISPLRRARETVWLRGVLKLRGPWPSEDAVLRLARARGDLRIHVVSDTRGVLLAYSEREEMWSAYLGRRRNGSPLLAELVFAARDDGLYRRAGKGAVEIRHAGGRLFLASGELPLVEVAAGLPREVYLEAGGSNVELSGITLYRDEVPRLPERTGSPRPVSARPPAELSWSGDLPEGAALERLPGGRVELRVSGRDATARVEAPLPPSTLGEIVLEVEAPSAGSGLWVAGGSGRPLYEVAFLEERNTGQIVFAGGRPSREDVGRRDTETSRDPRRGAVPFAGERLFLRIVRGVASVRSFASLDGTTWSEILEPALDRSPPEPVRSLGLYCVPGESPRRIRLRAIEVREPSFVADLAPPETLRSVPPVLPAGPGVDLAAWNRAVDELALPEIDPAVWRTAAALASLARAAPPELGRELLELLLSRAIDLERPPAERLRILAGVAPLVDHRAGAAGRELAERLVAAHIELGRRVFLAGEEKPFSLVWPFLVRLELGSEAEVDALPEELIEAELLALVHAGRVEETLRSRERILRLSGIRAGSWELGEASDLPPGRRRVLRLAEWARAVSLRLIARGHEAALASAVEWRHPLLEELSKEGYNTLAELVAALESDAWVDASSIITSSRSRGVVGLLPYTGDPRLAVSLPVAFTTSLRSHPELRRVMVEEFVPVGLVRVREAIGTEDVASLEDAAAQFPATRVAVEARCWLGDRALAGGDFAAATEHYLAAREDALGTADESEIAARLRLAAAFSGDDDPEARAEDRAGTVEIGGERFSAEEVERLVAEIRAGRQGAGERSFAGREDTSFPPGAWELRELFSHALEEDERPEGVPGDADWEGRLLAARVAGERLFVTSRARISVFDLASGEVRWTHEVEPARRDESGDLGPDVPVIEGTRLYVRRRARDGARLYCLDLEERRPLWRSERSRELISDAFLLRGRISALTATEVQEGVSQVSLASFDRENGEEIRSVPLFKLREEWLRRGGARVALEGTRLVIEAGGGIVATDGAGELLWVRREPWRDPWDDGAWPRAESGAPVVRNGRVFSLQPGVDAVTCLDLANGHAVWRRVSPSFERIVGFSEGCLILLAGDGLEAFDARTGEGRWRRTIEGLSGVRLAGTGEIVFAVAGTDSTRGEIELAWLDAASGEETARSTLAVDPGSDAFVFLEGTGMRLAAFGERGREHRGRSGRHTRRTIAALEAVRSASAR